MDDYNFKFRIGARIVALVDLIFTTIEFILSIIVAADTQTSLSTDPKFAKHATAVSWFLWIAVVILALITFVNLWASFQLIKATQVGRDLNEALKFSKFWMIITIIFLVLNVLSSIAMGYYIPLVVHALIRGLFMYIVYRFIKEVKLYVGVHPEGNA